MTTRRLALAHLAWLTSGCSGLLAPVDAPASAALIDKLPDDLPRAARPRGVLLVRPVTCRAAYDTARMAYRLRPHELDFYARHEWAERPAQMLQPLVVRALEAARCCTAVVTSAVAWDLDLRVHIEELVQDFAVDPPQLRLQLRIALGARERTVATRDITMAQVMRAKNAEAGVDAANEAAAKALRALAQQVIDAIAA